MRQNTYTWRTASSVFFFFNFFSASWFFALRKNSGLTLTPTHCHGRGNLQSWVLPTQHPLYGRRPCLLRLPLQELSIKNREHFPFRSLRRTYGIRCDRARTNDLLTMMVRRFANTRVCACLLPTANLQAITPAPLYTVNLNEFPSTDNTAHRRLCFPTQRFMKRRQLDDERRRRFTCAKFLSGEPTDPRVDALRSNQLSGFPLPYSRVFEFLQENTGSWK